jgi:enoyl-CoA hydratase/carnithine racemase
MSYSVLVLKEKMEKTRCNMSGKDPFKVEQEGHIAWLTLNRPDHRNIMGFAFFEGLVNHFERFDKDSSVRGVIIKGEGKSFTAGLDLVEFEPLLGGGSGADTREQLRKTILTCQEGMDAIERCRKPVIAAVHGHCIGGGVDLLCACDIRIATKDAVFSIRETRMGLIADLGTHQRFPHIVGHGWFRELALTGRDFTAQEALQMGFITRLCENPSGLYEEAKGIAAQIAACPPLAVQGTKDVILYSRDQGVHAGMHYVAQKNAAALPSEDVMEAVRAFMEKRPPVFKGK